MTLRRLFRSIIALTVAAGLMSAPAAATSFVKTDVTAGGTMQAANTHAAHMHAMEMHAMEVPAMEVPAMDSQATNPQAVTGEMPCCPDEGGASDCACPLLALCMLSISIPLPADAAALVTRHPRREAFSTRDDAWVQGLSGRPPDHPPRTMI